MTVLIFRGHPQPEKKGSMKRDKMPSIPLSIIFSLLIVERERFTISIKEVRSQLMYGVLPQ